MLGSIIQNLYSESDYYKTPETNKRKKFPKTVTNHYMWQLYLLNTG